MNTQAQHILVDIWLDSKLEPHHLETIKSLVEENLTVVRKIQHDFTPQGETIVWILAESHFSLHTYPENQYLSFDIYICNMEIDLKGLVEKMKAALPIKFIDEKYSLRGHKYQNHEITGQEFQFKNLSPEKKKDTTALLFFATIVASCSLLYELLLAQTLATTMGNTALRYNVTIGLYIASMGVGALFYNRLKTWWIERRRESEDSGFIQIEILLGIVGFIAPIIVLIFDSFFHLLDTKGILSYRSLISQSSIFAFNHFLIFVIGFVSGLELPLLMDLGKKIHREFDKRVLAFDYLGTLIAAVMFPILLVPYFKLFTLGALVAFFNTLVALIYLNYKKVYQLKLIIPLVVLIIAQLVFIFNEDVLNTWIIDSFYFLGVS